MSSESSSPSATVIPFTQAYQFHVYKHKIQKNRELSIYRMIVLKNREGRIVCFTGLEQFSYPYSGQKSKIKVRQKQELHYICKALNHIFLFNRIDKISDISAEMVFSFFEHYCNNPKDKLGEYMRTQPSIDKCVRHVTAFFCNLADAFPTKLNVEDLMIKEETKANRHSHRIVNRFVPRYVPKRPHSYDDPLLRDMPLAAAERLVELAYAHDPMIAFGIALQLYAGLRPSCVTNMRQPDSSVSPVLCFRISRIGTAISGMEIDLTHEYVLRSDGVSVGRIKKERTVEVYKGFLPELYNAYCFHLDHLKNIPCEEQYKPIFIGRNGKAMTYNTYANRIKKLVYGPLKDELTQSNDPVLSAFAQNLDFRRWAPHTLRHCFSVRLVLENMDVAQLQFYRGDSSPESAITYIANKGALTKTVQKQHEKVIEELKKTNRR